MVGATDWGLIGDIPPTKNRSQLVEKHMCQSQLSCEQSGIIGIVKPMVKIRIDDWITINHLCNYICIYIYIYDHKLITNHNRNNIRTLIQRTHQKVTQS